MRRIERPCLQFAAPAILFLMTLQIPLAPTRSVTAAPSNFEQPFVARIKTASRREVERLASLGLDLLEMRKGDDLFILTNAEQLWKLKSEGWDISVDEDQTAYLKEVGRNTFQGGYRTVAEMRGLLESAAQNNPDLAEFFIYGRSYLHWDTEGAAGHHLFGIKLTNMQIAGPKPTFFLMAAIHARELATSELALRFINHLLTGYGTDADATWLLDEHQIVVVPVINPDGRTVAEQGFFQRKNLNDTNGGECANPPTISNQTGIDLNRNSSFKWGVVNAPSEWTCGQTYPGPMPASEPETWAFQNLVLSLFADQRGPLDTDAAPMNTTGTMLTLHSYSDLVLWPWGWTTTAAPNATELSLIGRKYAQYNGYTPIQSIDLYPTSGTSDDWAYGELGIAALTFEVGPSSGPCGGFFPPFTCVDAGSGGSFWSRNLPAFLYAARVARAPYQLVRGPTPESAAATLTPQNQIDLRVTLDEQWNGGEAIAASEYYIATPPWRGGTPVAMAALDGSFDSQIEIAAATLAPLPERQLIYFRGRDSSGSWGPVRAVFSPAASCDNSISPASKAFSQLGGSGSIGVSSPNECNWSAASNVNWISITSGARGAGNLDVGYFVSQNKDERYRVGTVTVGDRTFAVRQRGTGSGSCVNALSPYSSSVPATGGTVSVSVVAAEGCIWTAAALSPWVSITSEENGIGQGVVTLAVAANTSGAARTAALTIAGQSFTVKQKGL